MIDSLSEIRLLAQSSLRYRRQVLALKHYFAKHGATVLLLDDLTTETLRQDRPQRRPRRDPAGGAGARIRRRAAAGAGGQVPRPPVPRRLPRLHHQDRAGWRSIRASSPAEHRTDFERTPLPSGVAGLDDLLGGGIERGSSALILGPAGTGKSLFAINFAVAAIARGEKAALFIFDEELGLLFDRDAEARHRPGGAARRPAT